MSKSVLILNHTAHWLCSQLSQAVPAFSYLPAETIDEAMEYANGAEILMSLAPQISEGLVTAMPHLEWVHTLTTGYDNLLTMPALKPEVAVSHSHGMHGPQMAELAILSMMSVTRRYADMIRNQDRALWQRWKQPLLLDKTICIVGLGSIAEALAERCHPFGMHITGVSNGRAEVAGFEKIYRRTELREAAVGADFLVVLVPYTSDTHHLIDGDILAAMKPTSYLINVARGGCVDEQAVVMHVSEGSIAGAALDVFATEPLPADSMLWSTPGVIVTPHIGGFSDTYYQQVLPIIKANLEGYDRAGASGLANRIERNVPV